MKIMDTLKSHQARLKKASHNEKEFKTALEKTVAALPTSEHSELIDWCQSEFGTKWEQIAIALVLQEKFKLNKNQNQK